MPEVQRQKVQKRAQSKGTGVDPDRRAPDNGALALKALEGVWILSKANRKLLQLCFDRTQGCRPVWGSGVGCAIDVLSSYVGFVFILRSPFSCGMWETILLPSLSL